MLAKTKEELVSSSKPDGFIEGKQIDSHATNNNSRTELDEISNNKGDCLESLNKNISELEPRGVVRWAADRFGGGLVLSTSFGIQAAVMLHLATSEVSDIPVVWVDTGYLPPETYRFADELTKRLNLNLQIYQSPISPARMEATLGRLFENNDVESLERYNFLRKVEPMQRALHELNATAWLAGLRADQTDHRNTMPIVDLQSERYKILPILHFNAKDVYAYLKEHDLPYHPFFERGYTSVGDWHSSRPASADDSHERDSRFRGVKQECGLHLSPEQSASLDSSCL